MRFEKLRLLGFKSFVEPTEFMIEDGLTGVVGPNGCGKSNLVEALRWVMGESSYKNMRASGMDDVIFSGSATRPSRNTAEVSLFLDNADRSAPAAYNDSETLQVTRRIEREAGSAYKINGKDARAKDVQLLFADQSTGARSPSMVGQGRIGELIQAKPQARRALLEEAAGISGLHSRRHEAELRLRGAETNLERLDDVIAELDGQIDSLKRQARQANRFRNLSREIRQAEATLLHLKWVAAKDAEASGDTSLSAATKEVAERAEVQTTAAKAQAIAQKALPALREAEAAAAAALQRLTIARDQLAAEAERLAARRSEYESRIAQLTGDIEREEQLVAENADILARLAAEEEQLQKSESGSGTQEEKLRIALDEKQESLAASEAELARLTAERAETGALRTQLERRIREASERAERIGGQLSASKQELEAVSDKLASLADPAARQADVEIADAAVAQAEKDVSEAEQKTSDLRQAENAAQPDLAAARSTLDTLQAEARTLAKLVNAGASELFPAIIETLVVDSGFELALGAALGDDLDVPADAAAPVHWAKIGFSGEDPDLPAGSKPLTDHVKAPAELNRLLAHIGIVEDHQQGAALRDQLKPGQCLVTKDGAVWRWDGYTAAADAPTAAAERLARKNRLAELDTQIGDATKALSTAEKALEAARSETSDAAGREQAARQTLRQAQDGARLAREALAAAERAAGDLTRKRAVLEEQINLAGKDLEDTGALRQEAETALAAEPDLSELEAALEKLQTRVAGDRAETAEARAAHQGFAREREMRMARIEAIRNERAGWISRADNAGRQIENLRQRETDARSALADIDDAPDELDKKRAALQGEIDTAEAARRDKADALAVAENNARDADRMASDCIQELALAREERARVEERLEATRQRRSDIEARIGEALNCAPHEAFALTGLEADAPLPDADKLERQLEKLKIERERLGAVNLRAEEEQSELHERSDTLTAERDDIVEAIRELRSAIASLNREGRERLLAAFEKVQEQFTRLFTHLFGGGTAELQLIESDDPLEAGLEIVARPPGKKPQTMTLLSGGEQALTAMALIFAVFLTNPAPICVLDEVDAPLDDHNVERFCDLMDEMARSTDTRFVIITHNPITMARMSRLFGVTMSEQGVSQLVSVDLQRAEELREAS